MKRIERLVAASSAALLFCGALVVSSAWAGPMASDNELLLNGSFFHRQGSDAGAINADLSYGRYFGNPAWQVGIRQGLSWIIVDDASDPWFATTAPFVKYHFLGMSQDDWLVPFVGGQIGLAWNDDDATGLLGPAAGAKFFVTEQAFILTEYRYEWFFDELDQADDTSDDGNHLVSLGIGYVWGGHDGRR